MVSLPVDSRVAFLNARRLLSTFEDLFLLYNPAGTQFEDVRTFWFDASRGEWQAFEEQSLRSNSFKMVVPVGGLLLSTNGYKVQIAVFGIPSSGTGEGGARRDGSMLPPGDTNATDENTWENPSIPVTTASSILMETSTTTSTVGTTTSTTKIAQTTTASGGVPSTSPAPAAASSDNNNLTLLLAIGGGGGVLIILLVVILICCCKKSDADDEEEEEEENPAQTRRPVEKNPVAGSSLKSMFALDSSASLSSAFVPRSAGRGRQLDKKWD